MWPYSYHDECDAGITANQSQTDGLSYLPVFVLKFALLDRLVFGIEDNAAARRRRIRDSRAQVPTSVANPFAQMQTSPRVQLKRLMVDAPSLIVACGLAMRRFDPQ